MTSQLHLVIPEFPSAYGQDTVEKSCWANPFLLPLLFSDTWKDYASLQTHRGRGQRQRPTAEKNIAKPELVRHNNWKEEKKFQINKVFTETCLSHVGGGVNTCFGVLAVKRISFLSKSIMD